MSLFNGAGVLRLYNHLLLSVTTMNVFRALTWGQQEDPLCRTLRSFDVPITTADCRACTEPCDLGELPRQKLI